MPTTKELFPGFNPPNFPSPLDEGKRIHRLIELKRLYRRRTDINPRFSNYQYTILAANRVLTKRYHHVNFAYSTFVHTTFVGVFLRCSFYNASFYSAHFNPDACFIECDFTGAAFNDSLIPATTLSQLSGANLTHITTHAHIT